MSDTELSLHRVLSAPRDAVWRAWADPDLLAEWFVPRPWRAEIAEYAFEPGGAFVTIMHGPDGERMEAGGCILAVDPEARLVWTNALAGGWRPVASDMAFTATITLTDAGQGTDYSCRLVHADAEGCARHAEMGFHEGWGAALAQLEEVAQRIAAAD